ncbi:helix-turn-helix transcriptional regulator [Tenggerimyces flavus]|uniref:Helix-turn-helix transcriptional regulator n=1 Tax=Tenggerimyces flavus TaxID=1708749 RepID=A0ABV7YNR8_9ACTN|nr:helix-turn-helix transcriptional regulator [Tenggerimyces flavus]MBM7784778.1 transcriptional regulator with XRE-family HTH domain [Tenggerimyces flavus]
MSSENQLGEFLRARREVAQPGDLGLPDPGRRRVPGLRREEVAMLAGVSADYYVRLEQGRDRHPSEQVLEALARVLGLNDEAASHLHSLARPSPRRRRSTARSERVEPGVQRLLDAWTSTPAVVFGRYLDVLAANTLALALNRCSAPGHNQLRAIFLDPESHEIYPEWDSVAADSVASLRAAAGSDLDDPRLTDLVGELSLKSAEFRQLWARHDVRTKTRGTKRFLHPMVGEVTVGFESLAITGSPGQVLAVYHAEPGSPSERALALLGSASVPEASEVTERS